MHPNDSGEPDNRRRRRCQASCMACWSGEIATSLHRDVVVHASAPIGRLDGFDAAQETIGDQLTVSLTSPDWEPYLFLGGVWEDQVWVAHTGHLSGVFTEGLWGIPPSGQRVSLRYGNFSRVENGATVEVRMLFDVLGLAAQSGIHLLPNLPVATVSLQAQRRPTESCRERRTMPSRSTPWSWSKPCSAAVTDSMVAISSRWEWLPIGTTTWCGTAARHRLHLRLPGISGLRSGT